MTLCNDTHTLYRGTMAVVLQYDAEVSVGFAIGEKFPSYSAQKEKICAYEESTNIQLNHSDSKTLEVARKRVPCKVEKAKDLVYYYINFSCVFGGKKYQCKGSGKRP